MLSLWKKTQSDTYLRSYYLDFYGVLIEYSHPLWPALFKHYPTPASKEQVLKPPARETAPPNAADWVFRTNCTTISAPKPMPNSPTTFILLPSIWSQCVTTFIVHIRIPSSNAAINFGLSP